MNFLRKRLLTLEWDKTNNQLNAGIADKLGPLKKEYEELAKKAKAFPLNP